MLILNKNILTIGGNRLEGGPLNPPTPPGPSFDEVTIGTQTWTSKNLDIDDGGEGITIINDVTANGVNFGTQYYYNWDAANRIANSIIGWHLPSQSEWGILKKYLNNDTTTVKSTSGWNNNNGTNTTGLNILPLGIVETSTNRNLGNNANLWTTTTYNSNSSYQYILYDAQSVFNTAKLANSYYLSVRLIKDI